MTTDTEAVPANPWMQAGGLAFLALYGVVVFMALAWLTANVRQIPPESRAVVVRMGKLQRVQSAGLLLAWPRPFEEVRLLPASESVLERDVSDSANPILPGIKMTDATASVGNRLTGDAGVVQMDIRVFYTVDHPYEYLLQREHLDAALDRLVSRSVVAVCASRDLDAILVARPELLGTQAEFAEQRERLRGDARDNINRYLDQLHRDGAGYGIRVVRVDLVTRLHPDTVIAFDSVLTATQQALQEVANARTDAARTLQTANEMADRTLQIVQAQSSERLSKAQADTADVLRLAQAMKGDSDRGLMTRMYRERMASILAKTQSIAMVNPRDASHLIVRGTAR